MNKKSELQFYEGMFAIQFCCSLIFSMLFILSIVVCFIIDYNLFYIPISILGGIFYNSRRYLSMGSKFVKKDYSE